MSRVWAILRFLTVGLTAGFVGVSVGLAAPPSANDKQPVQTIGMFEAIEKGQIAVQVRPKDAHQINVIIENKTKQPLRIGLPRAFAAVPVLAQFEGAVGGIGGLGAPGGGYGGYGTTGYGGRYGYGGGQGLGGGWGGYGGYGGFGGYGGGYGGFWNVPPEKTVRLKAPTVCLEYGKPDPKPSMVYEIKPLEALTDKPEVKELIYMLADGTAPQDIIQLAAWHLNNGVSWQELASKRYRSAVVAFSRPMYSPQQIQAAMMLAQQAKKMAAERQKREKSVDSSYSMNR